MQRKTHLSFDIFHDINLLPLSYVFSIMSGASRHCRLTVCKRASHHACYYYVNFCLPVLGKTKRSAVFMMCQFLSSVPISIVWCHLTCPPLQICSVLLLPVSFPLLILYYVKKKKPDWWCLTYNGLLFRESMNSWHSWAVLLHWRTGNRVSIMQPLDTYCIAPGIYRSEIKLIICTLAHFMNCPMIPTAFCYSLFQLT